MMQTQGRKALTLVLVLFLPTIFITLYYGYTEKFDTTPKYRAETSSDETQKPPDIPVAKTRAKFRPELVAKKSLQHDLALNSDVDRAQVSTRGQDQAIVINRNTSSPVQNFTKIPDNHPAHNVNLKKNSTSDIENRQGPGVLEKPHVQLKIAKKLSPLASLTQRFLSADPPLNSEQFNRIYQKGAGLEEVTVEGGVKTWKENGIVYMTPKHMNETSDPRSPFLADFYPYIPYNHTLFFEGKSQDQKLPSEKKIIFGRLVGSEKADKPIPLKACPEFPCVMTTNSKYQENASALIFNGKSVRGSLPKRRPDQIFVFYIYEPLVPKWTSISSYHIIKFGWRDAFNWTMSYHSDADLFMPYGMVRRRRTPIVKDYASILAQKTKLVAWMVSHCSTHGKREEYVKQLQKYIQVDVYGACGTLRCHRNKDLECFTNISQTYKFYLSFESGICDGYVTEKAFKYLRTDLIPVLRGEKHFYIPSDIVINTRDFESPKALAEWLHYLDQHDDLYIDFLRKKDQYFVSFDTHVHLAGRSLWNKCDWENVPICEICQRLWNIDDYSGYYEDIDKWFKDRHCKKPRDLSETA